ncbi:MAG: efflux RND transporter periplasmic adaptor subunit [Cryobacterium sp.]|uniref:efflux RND transporter periplasmic adaptor subunit n=1 Tax=unclassified Cryobacterium TaxID=2649013 RepID=UPI0018CB9195|nr:MULTISPECIES: efflux RND transporter periplasmic adaptor subunit [unclassified Cryobacterium]MCY7403425.1 efflux RND transporter periplasmic adaptor subunit [Cryobacterium sp.]MEC5155564.1 macrolide-specific efflux system membrane fusion protein [Cryobacterium sp. CAN_C3]
MNIARKWVFPILRLICIAAIAVALVKIAFYPDNAVDSNPAEPTGVIVEPQIPVALGTISNDVTLPGTVSADPAVAVKATAIGTVDEIFVAAGLAVNKDDKIYDIRVETIKDPVETTDADGNVTITQPKPVITFAKVLAPIAGILSSLGVIHGQSVAVGDATGQVAPPSFSVSGALSPEQQYRLLTKPNDASVAITNGPAPFTCTGLTITTPLAGATTGGDGGAGGQTGTSGTTVTCAIPAEVTVFSGLAAQITIAAGLAENVLVVPTTAVKGSAETGVVWFVVPDGGTEERPVMLGMTDGINVQIIDGLIEGDLINQFVPGATAVAPGTGGCDLQPDGSTVCFDGGISSSGISK